MSSNRTDLQLMLDNRANVSKNTVGLVKISGQNINVFEINADGSSFPTQITFNNIVVPNYQNTIVSRNVRVRYQLAVRCDQSVATGASPVMPAPLGNIIGGTTPGNAASNAVINTVLRAFPMQSCCNNVQVIINGATTTLNAQQTLSALQRTLPYGWIKQQALECPAMADNQAYFGNCVDGTYGGAGVASGHSNQVFSSATNSDGATRGSFQATSVTMAANIATYLFDISESILISPFTIYDDEVWLSNINTMSLQFNYSSLLDMIEYANQTVAPATAVTCTITNPRLELTYMQLNPDLVSIPRVTTLPYENIVYFPKNNGSGYNLTVTTPFQLNTDTLRLSSLPERIYIFARPPISARAAAAPSAQADSFISLGNQDGTAGLSISIGTRTGLLASASNKTLFRMSKKNGYRGTYFDWMYGSGGLLIIDPVDLCWQKEDVKGSNFLVTAY